VSTSTRLFSAFFTAMPGFIFSVLFLFSRWLGREYWGGTYLMVLVVLPIASLSFGFKLPNLFQKLRIRQAWIWILIQGLLAWIVALIVLGFLNLTPLCIGQDNGDGNNDIGMCFFMTALSGLVYTPLYLGMQTISALIGHWVIKYQTGISQAE
jgi:hypothetical protein